LHIFIGFFNIKINAKGAAMNELAGVWLSINDYSRYKNVSISTIRRHIKTNILKYKEENGKYFIYVPSTEKLRLREEEEILKTKLECELLRTQVRQLREENNELKMLVELYEKQNSKTIRSELPPEFPINL
jgi:homoserine trans-succinylase